jgi:Ca2+-binding RTX toxin-like protein
MGTFSPQPPRGDCAYNICVTAFPQQSLPGGRIANGWNMASLKTIIDGVRADPGLKDSISKAKIEKGIDAARRMNDVLLTVLEQINALDDGIVSVGEMREVSEITYRTPEFFRAFILGHGNDAGRTTGFHHVQNDGATLLFQGRNFVDTVADAIYHFGFQIRNGRYYNEDGNDNERVDDVIGWLNYFLFGKNTVFGTDGADELSSGQYSKPFRSAASEWWYAGEGNDKIWADKGNDRIFGGAGADQSGGGDGRDRMYGEAGNDTLWSDDGRDSIFGGAGDEEMGGGTGGDLLDGGEGQDVIYGWTGNDRIFGGLGNDDAHGDQGNDRMFGGDGADSFSGGAGADFIDGGGGRDELGGGDQADTILGGEGADRIYLWEEGKARDVLIFRVGDSGLSGDEMDYVEGFVSGQDKINLSSLGPMTYRADDYRGGGNASCYFAEETLLIDANGDGQTDMKITFRYTPDLRAADFIFG